MESKKNLAIEARRKMAGRPVLYVRALLCGLRPDSLDGQGGRLSTQGVRTWSGPARVRTERFSGVLLYLSAWKSHVVKRPVRIRGLRFPPV